MQARNNVVTTAGIPTQSGDGNSTGITGGHSETTLMSGTSSWNGLSAEMPPTIQSGAMAASPSAIYQGRDQGNPGDWHDLGARPRRPLGNGNQRDKKKVRGTGEQTSAGNQKKKKSTKLGRQSTSRGTQKVVKETKITMPDDGDSS